LKNPEQPNGFSLTETVIALGLFAFCILPIIALVPVGMGAARSVAQESDAASLAAAFFGAWELRPAGAKDFPIPMMFTNPAVPLEQGGKTMYFAGDGTQTIQAGATMKLDYKITTNASTATINLDFTWPANGGPAAQTRSFTRTFPL